MILGAVGRELSPDPGRGFTLQASDVRPGQVASRVYRSARPIGSLDARDSLIADAASGAWLAFSGNPLLVSAAGVIARGAPLNAARLLAMLEADGVRALDQVDGQFAIAWWSARRGMLSLIRDRFGMESLCYSSGDRQLVFGTLARDVAASVAARPGLSMQGVVEYLTHCYLPGTNTLFEGIFRVPAGALVEYAAATGSCRVNYWYRLSYANPLAPDEAAIATHYREMLEASVVRRLSDDRTGVFLSGGMDSSSAATFARKHLSGPISSYSFRCLGASFDESPFARELARELGTEHTEVDFGELQSLDAVAAVGAMDMPFCDIGIEIGTWLLAKAASGNVDYLLTGDGGDELWASHPVYAAQRIMQWYDRMPIPRALRTVLVRTCALVRDSDKKRNLAVVLKRLLPEPAYPNDLMHYRWKMYYTSDGLRDLLTPGLAGAVAATEPFQAVTEAFAHYQGPDDGISACLYSDYRTISSFYFSRMSLARSFGLEVRMPFYDRDLVEYGARIPLNLKLEGLERTKRLFRVAMEGVLPDIINHRRDKLGHSVPFKNWLRESGPLSAQVAETLSSKAFLDRGLFRPQAIKRMLDEHRARRHNHSHRIWTLFILEHWFRQHFNMASASAVVFPRSRAA
jgi:asparagine synthase (glutamine-hydrolysing)